MKRILLFVTILFYSFLNADYLDITLENKSNYHFEDYLFNDINVTRDINTTKTGKLEKILSYNELHIGGNFNNIVGFNYYKNNLSSPDSFDSKEVYFGSSKTKFLSFQQDKTTIHYNTRVHNRETSKYTIYDILTIEKNKITSTDQENFYQNYTAQTGLFGPVTVYRSMDYEKITLTSENLYNHVKENALDGENYFYWVSVSQNFNSMFRLYGVAIASYEQHDYSDGEANYNTTDGNGTIVSINVFNTSRGDAKIADYLATDGKFKGFGYGYKLTAEAYWKDFSFFVTSYYKKTNLKNYHTAVRDALPDTDPVANIISNDKLLFLQKYTSFGFRYRF